MKIAILNDTHFGYSGANDNFMEYQKRFLDLFFDYCVEHGIDTLIHLGDLFHDRKSIPVKTMKFVRESFLTRLEDNDITMHIIPGNHDCAFKNTNDVCSVYEILQRGWDNVHLYMEPKTLDFDGRSVTLIPWISDSNRDVCIDAIKTSDPDVIIGHFDIEGFKYIANSGIRSSGFKPSMFKQYDMVLSGHYHTKSGSKNITYLGSQYQFNWSDVDDTKFFHVLDTSNLELIEVENPDKLYHNFYYDDEDVDNVADLMSVFDGISVAGKIARVYVTTRKDMKLFYEYSKLVSDLPFSDLEIIEPIDGVTHGEDADAEIEVGDTISLIDDYVQKSLETELDKKRLNKEMAKLYAEAVASDTI